MRDANNIGKEHDSVRYLAVFEGFVQGRQPLLNTYVKEDQVFNHRRKFRSQTSDSMQRWKSRGGKSQRGEVKK